MVLESISHDLHALQGVWIVGSNNNGNDTKQKGLGHHFILIEKWAYYLLFICFEKFVGILMGSWLSIDMVIRF